MSLLINTDLVKKKNNNNYINMILVDETYPINVILA